MTGDPRKPSILIVDDAPMNIKVLSAAIAGDYEISAAINGEEALQSVADAPPDMILLDIRMPGMDGFTVCARLKAQASTRDIPVIFITAESDAHNETRGLEVGAVDFIAKPINPPVVLARIKTHLALKKAQMSAVQAAQAKSQFLALMSHEIRTPLNGVLGFTSLLAKEALGDKARQFLDIIQQSGQHLLVIVNDILDYSKLEANKIRIEAVPFAVRKILAGVVDVLSLSARSKDITLAWHCADTVPAVLCGDPNRLRQILYNLAANAIKFTPQGRVDVQVSLVRQGDADLLLQFSVQDTGIGMAADEMQHLFQPFAQATTATARQFGGTGLGLFICARLVHLMGGEIQVNSEPGKGSCFQFTATFAPSTLPVAALACASDPQANRLQQHGHYQLLVADDVAVNRIYLSELLPSFGIHSFELVCNGQEALARLQERSFDLVLMDCRMPVMDGFAATRLLRRQEEAAGQTRHTPVIALTASVTEEDRQQCLASGMDDVLTKPVDGQTLLQMLTRWLEVAPAVSAPAPACCAQPVPGLPSAVGCAVDEAALDEKVHKMGKERMGRLVHAFLQDLARNMAALRTAVKAYHAGGVLEAAHALKGCCGVVHATRMMCWCGEMQAMGKTDALQGAEELLAQLEAESLCVQKILQEKLT